MRIALLYPPPWKIAEPGHAGYGDEGPPLDFQPRDLDADFYQTPYGLFSLGAQGLRAGHSVKVLNLSSFTWPKVEEVLGRLDAEVYGLSCWTANRRGVGYVVALIKKLRPEATVIVGGPHATPLAEDMLRHHPDIDLVCYGESDATFLEILKRKGEGLPLTGIESTVYRGESGAIVRADERAQYKNLDDLASPQDYFDTHILMTSRGCPWACTFCGAETSWGRGFRSNSVDYVVTAMAKVLERLPVKMVQIKDDTFTTHKKRVLDLCKEIRKRNLRFFWSCDTRVDLLNDELLREMRLAGCQRLSLGVESGSQRILDAIDKKITVAEIEESTRLAKKYGIKVRHYMMLGNRGETRASFEETLAFLQRARPHEYVFSCLSIYPGTRDFYDAEVPAEGPKTEKRWLDRNVYFTGSFQELKTPFDASPEDTAFLNAWFQKNSGLRTLQHDGVPEYQAILEALGEEYHAAHMDLGAAHYHAGALDLAEHHVKKALELGYPLPGLVYNHLACIAKARGDLDAMMDLFSTAAKGDPQHFVLIQNVQRARKWFKEGGYARKEPLELEVRHDFQLLERTAQPSLPGPLPDDYDVWSAAPAPYEPAPAFVKTPEQEGSTAELRTRLRIL